jgi:hypothetical protein
MMRLLPRHQFGLVQRHLFPKYFFLTTAFSFGSLSTYLGYKPVSTWKDESLILVINFINDPNFDMSYHYHYLSFERKKGGLMATSFLLSSFNFTCFNVNSSKYNSKMHEIEKQAGEGITTIGKLMQESKVESDPVINLSYLCLTLQHIFYS